MHFTARAWNCTVQAGVLQYPITCSMARSRPSDAYKRQKSSQHCFRQWLAPGRRQAIIFTKAGILLIRPLETNFSEILIEIHTFSSKKMHFKMSSGKWRPFCLGLNELSISRLRDFRWSCVKTSYAIPKRSVESGYNGWYNRNKIKPNKTMCTYHET